MEKLATKEKIKISIFNKKNKKALMVIAFRDFKDEEYFIPKEILEKRGIEIKTVSTKLGTAIGVEGGETKVDYLLKEADINNFDALIFAGGPGCLKDLDNENSYRLVKEVVVQNKLLAAICISPVILAKAGVLKEKIATVWTSPFDKSAIKILEENGAKFVNENVVQDGRIITANGPTAAKEFGEKILKNLL